MRISRGGFNKRNHAIVQIETDEGLTGLGEGVGTAAYVKAIIDAHMGEMARGLDPCDIENLRERLLDSEVYFERMGSAICAASAIEMACWDIKGKALGVPVYQLFGGKCRDELELYASNVYWVEDDREMAKCAEDILSQGITTIKAHLGWQGPDEDAKKVALLRDVIGKDARLMIDLNAGYSYADALRAADIWSKYDLFWLEEPLNPNHARRQAELKRHTSIPIACGENEFQIFGFKDLFEKEAVDIAMPDIGRAGGIQETYNICSLAEGFGVQVSPHNYSSGVLLAATMHLMAALPNTFLLEYDASTNAVYYDFFSEKPAIKDGKIQIPNKPGLGVELPKEVLDKYLARKA